MSGFNVYPTEVEDVIEEVDGVEDVAVIGVEDPLTGEAVVAYVLAPGADAAADHRRRTRPLRRPAGPVQAADPHRGGRRAAQDGDREGAEGPAARHRAPPRPRDSSSDHPVTARVTLYSRPGCHLCDDARAVIERVCADLGEEYVEVSIDDDPELQSRFGEEIPVTFVDGRQHDFWRVDEARLRAALGG